MQRDMLCDIQSEGGLSHRRTSRHDDEVSRLQTGRPVVKIVEARGHASDVGRIFLVVQVVDAFVDLCEDRRNAKQALVFACSSLGNLEDFRLGFIQQLADFLTGRGERAFSDFRRDLPESSLYRAIAYKLRVAADVDRAWRILRKLSEISSAAGLVLV